jgi:nucleoside-diphosphate-sugar epimerase
METVDNVEIYYYVKNIVNAIYFLFKNPSKTEIFNLSTEKSRTWNDIAKSIFVVAGKKEK